MLSDDTALYFYHMRKLILIITLIILSSSIAFGQIFSLQWQQCFGGSDQDLTSDILLYNTGYIIVGGTYSSDGDISIHYGGEDGWIIMTDSVGNLIWEKSYGGSLGDGFSRILRTNDGNFYLVGGTWSSDGTIGIDPYLDSEDYWIMKIDTLGNILWEKLIGGNGTDLIWDAVKTSDGGLISVGWTTSEDGDVSQYFGGWDTWVVKLDSTGEIEWDKTIGTTNGFEYGYAIIQTSDGGYLVGIAANPLGEGNVTCIPHSYNAEGILFKLDANGNEIWQQCYGGWNHDGITLLLELPDGYIFSGYTSSVDGDLTGAGYHFGGDDIWIAKTDFTGNSIWHKCYGGSGADYLHNFFPTEDSGFIVIGNTNSHNGDVVGNHSGGYTWKDIWVFKINSTGEMEWQQCFGGIANETLENRGVVKKSDYNFVIAGSTTWSPSFDVDCDCQNNTYPDYWLFEILDTTVTVTEIPEYDDIEVYPNPANSILNISLPESYNFDKANLNLTDITGKTILTFDIAEHSFPLDVSHLNSGIYFLRISNNEILKTLKVLIY